MKKILILFLFLFPPLLYAQTITYSGTNVGIGSSAPGQTLDVQGTIRATAYINSLSFISSASFSLASSFTFSGLTTGTKYVLYMNFIQNTANAEYYLRYNGDSGNNYSYSVIANDSQSLRGATDSGIEQSWIDDGASVPGTAWVGQLTFMSAETNYVRHWGHFNSTDTSSQAEHISSGLYQGSAGLSSISIYAGGGTITGNAYLYQVN